MAEGYGGCLRKGVRCVEVTAFSLAKCHLQDLGEVQSVAVGALGDLLAATETVGDNQSFWGGGADGREEFELADGLGDRVFFFFESERSGHAAAAWSGGVEIEAEAGEDGFFGGHFHDGFVVAVAVDEGFAAQRRDGEI